MLSDKILNHIVIEKRYLDPEFSVHDICQRLKNPRHRVQYCLNVIINKKFADVKNEVRVNYAKDFTHGYSHSTTLWFCIPFAPATHNCEAVKCD